MGYFSSLLSLSCMSLTWPTVTEEKKLPMNRSSKQKVAGRIVSQLRKLRFPLIISITYRCTYISWKLLWYRVSILWQVYSAWKDLYINLEGHDTPLKSCTMKPVYNDQGRWSPFPSANFVCLHTCMGLNAHRMISILSWTWNKIWRAPQINRKGRGRIKKNGTMSSTMWFPSVSALCTNSGLWWR